MEAEALEGQGTEAIGEIQQQQRVVNGNDPITIEASSSNFGGGKTTVSQGSASQSTSGGKGRGQGSAGGARTRGPVETAIREKLTPEEQIGLDVLVGHMLKKGKNPETSLPKIPEVHLRAMCQKHYNNAQKHARHDRVQNADPLDPQVKVLNEPRGNIHIRYETQPPPARRLPRRRPWRPPPESRSSCSETTRWATTTRASTGSSAPHAGPCP